MPTHGRDSQNDLALIKPEQSSSNNAPIKNFAMIRNGDVELGESVLVSGFPYGDLVSNNVKITSGIVSSTTGLGDNSGQFQIDAAVQPGNSGGPIPDKAGRVVGVVVAQFNKLKMAEISGCVPENTNFGIKGSALTAFLESAGVELQRVGKEPKLPLERVAQMAESASFMISCAR